MPRDAVDVARSPEQSESAGELVQVQVADPTVPVDVPRSQEVEPQLSQTSLVVGKGTNASSMMGSVNKSASQSMRVSSLGTSTSDLLRAVPASVPLRWLGQMLRRSTPNSHLESCKVEHIQVFWSHSWSSKIWHKVLMLCMYHNAVPSMVFGAVAASLCTLLLPVRWLQHEEVAGLAGILAGLLLSFLVLLGWPCRDIVFLDKACINQDDIELKRQGVMSLGFFIRRSKKMLILWDGTYLTRLWCVFEFAARLHLQAEDPKVGSFQVMPTVLAFFAMCAYAGHTCSIVSLNMMNLLLGPNEPTLARTLKDLGIMSASMFVGVIAVAHPVRSYMVELFHQAQQLERFCIQNAACFCCTHNHRHPETGETLPCDRLMIEEIVKLWFGSTENFDRFARVQMLRCTTVKEMLMPYWVTAFACQPFFWEGLGRSMWLLKAGQTSYGVVHLVERTVQAAFINPICVRIINRSFTTRFGKDAARAAYVGLLLLITLFIVLVNSPLKALALVLSRHGSWWGRASTCVIFGVLNFLCFRHELKS